MPLFALAALIASPRLTAFILLSFSLSLSSIALSAEPEENAPQADEHGKITYKPAYFAQFNPITATDILKQIPGVVIERGRGRRGGGGGNQRGFGSQGGNILINGKRISGKSNNSGSALDRIQASQIESIEVIRGTSPDINAKNNDTIINIVMKTNAQKASVSWALGFNQPEPGVQNPEVEITVGGDYGSLNYLTTVQFKRHGRRENAHRESFTSSNVLFEMRDDLSIRSDDHALISGNFIYSFEDTNELRLNILLDKKEDDDFEIREEYLISPLGISTFDSEKKQTSTDDEDRIEIGGDYEIKINGGNSVKFLFLYNNLTQTESDELNNITTTPLTEDLEITDSEEQEKIIRGSHRWAEITSTQSLEIGLEMAVNSLDINKKIFEDVAGILTPVDLGLSDSLVEEVRYELFSKHTWDITDKLFAETAINFEDSEITQSGSTISNARRFSFIKPSIDVRYDPNPNEQYKFSINKSVGQLDFDDFVDSLTQEDRQIKAGNPDLKPDSTIEYSISYENRPENNTGVYNARIFYQDISDYIDRIVSLGDPTSSATGNIGNAEVLGIELESSTKLTKFDLPNAVLTLKAKFQNSETIDAFRGTKRDLRFKPDHEFSLKFHHDVVSYKFSYGFNLNKQSERFFGDIEEDRFMNRDISNYLYIEKHLGSTMKLRFTARNIADFQQDRFRRLYDTNKVNNILDENEFEETITTEEYHLTLSGTF